MIAIAVFSFFIIFIILLIAPGQLLALLGIPQKAYAMISSVPSSPVNPFQCFHCCFIYMIIAQWQQNFILPHLPTLTLSLNYVH